MARVLLPRWISQAFATSIIAQSHNGSSKDRQNRSPFFSLASACIADALLALDSVLALLVF